MAAILLLVAAAEVPIVLFTRKPLPWVAVIPALIPILTAVFVIIPMMTAEKIGSLRRLSLAAAS